jgi:hypothetical protein
VTFFNQDQSADGAAGAVCDVHVDMMCEAKKVLGISLSPSNPLRGTIFSSLSQMLLPFPATDIF